MEARFPVRLLDRRSYIDTVRLQLPYGISGRDYRILRRAAGGRILHKRVHYDGGWCFFLTMHQPTKEALELLLGSQSRDPGAGTARAQFKIVQVDVALDLIVASKAAALKATRYLQGRIFPVGTRHRKPWTLRPVEKPNAAAEFDVGVLGYQLRKGVRTVVYGDRRTKTWGRGYCAHIECRVLRKDSLKEFGLHDVGQLLTFNHFVFWRKTLRLAQPPTEKRLAEVIAKRRRRLAKRDESSGSLYYSPERLAHLLIRGHSDEDWLTNSYDLLHKLKEFERLVGPRPQRLYKDIDIMHLLPECTENALWE